MKRLAEYMLEFAGLLGNQETVHFSKLLKGSTQITAKIEHEAIPKVEERIRLVRAGGGAEDAVKCFKSLNNLLREDNATGDLHIGRTKILPFPGIKEMKPLPIGPIKQDGSVDGLLIRLGGKDATVPAALIDKEGKVHTCTTTVVIARELKKYLLEPVTIRVLGTGKWMRSIEGVWELEDFVIKGFEELDDTPLNAVLEKLRALPGNNWVNLDDPFAYLQQLRNGPKNGLH